MKTFGKIAIIGGGNLGRAIAQGLLKDPHFEPSQLTITRRKVSRLSDLADAGISTLSDNQKAVQDADLILLGVQPVQIEGVIQEILPQLDPERHVLASLATGFTLEEMQAIVGDEIPLYRAMPNTATALRESMTCIATKDPDQDRRQAIIHFFERLGTAIIIEEALMASATVLGACGIAFALRFIRAASQGGTEIGFEAELAQLIATQTVKGAAALLLKGGNHPEREIDKVTTPRGCTIAGLNQMEHQGFSSALIRGITTSYHKIEDI